MMMMNVLLLETAALWGDMASGLEVEVSSGTQICTITSGSSERFVTVLCSFVFVIHLVMTGLVVFWKDELVQSSSFHSYGGLSSEFPGYQNNGRGYQQGHTEQHPGPPGSAMKMSSRHASNVDRNPRQFSIDDDDDEEDDNIDAEL